MLDHLQVCNKAKVVESKFNIEKSIHMLFFQLFLTAILLDFVKYCILTLIKPNWGGFFHLILELFVVITTCLLFLLILSAL